MAKNIGLVALALVAVAGTANAGTIRVNGEGFNVGGGGEFRATSVSGNNGQVDSFNHFRTFCLESAEGISLGGSTYRTEIASSTFNNGGAGTRPLAEKVAFLYTQFRKGTLSEYNFANVDNGGLFDDRRSSAFQLQRAIWFLMGVRPDIDGASNYYVQLANTAVANGDWSGLGNVRVLRLFDGPNSDQFGNNQDVLTLVPLPGAGGAAFAGLVGLAAFRRRRA